MGTESRFYDVYRSLSTARHLSLFLELCGFFPYLDIRTIPTNSCIQEPAWFVPVCQGLAARVQTEFLAFLAKIRNFLPLTQVHATFFAKILVFLRKYLLNCSIFRKHLQDGEDWKQAWKFFKTILAQTFFCVF